MIQNPSPAARRTKTPGNLKRDINLLPANENSEKIARRGTIILAVFMGVLLFSYFAIYLPLAHVKILQEKAESMENQATILEAQGSEMDSKVELRNALKEMNDSLDKTEKSGIRPADVFAMLETTCPDTIKLLSVTKNNGGLTISGLAANDAEVAQFIVNLKTQPYLHNVKLTGVRDDEENLKATQKRFFEVKADTSDATDPTAAPVVPEPTAKGGDGK